MEREGIKLMKFSALMSIYHKENPSHFNACMESIWDNQTLKPTEIILVEDGKLTDELYFIINEWKIKLGDVLKVKSLEENLGTGKAKNLGLAICTHDIVCIVDTDDICVPERFEKQMELLEQHPEVTIVGGQIIEFVDSINQPSGIRNLPETHGDLVKFAKYRSPLNNMTIAYKRKDIISVGGYQHHLWMEDYNLYLRVLSQGFKIHNLQDILVYARVDNGMHARRKGLEYIKSEKQLLDLKKQLKIQNSLMANLLFLFRASLRLLPTSLLKGFYNQFLRKKV